MKRAENIINEVFDDLWRRTIDYDSDWTYLRISSINDIIFSKVSKILNLQNKNKSVGFIRVELIEIIMHAFFGLFQIEFNNIEGEHIQKDLVLSLIEKNKSHINKYINYEDNDGSYKISFDSILNDTKELQSLDNKELIPAQYTDYYFRFISKLILFTSQLNEK